MVVVKQTENNINIFFLGPLVDYLLQFLNARSMSQIFANWNLTERAEKEIKDLKGIFFWQVFEISIGKQIINYGNFFLVKRQTH